MDHISTVKAVLGPFISPLLPRAPFARGRPSCVADFSEEIEGPKAVTMSEVQRPRIHDVIIIGAGPCGLGVASRLREHCPSALFTDDEHQRYHWIQKHGRKMALKNKKTGRVKNRMSPCEGREYSTLVLDATGDRWMNRWKTLFTAFDIHHLRSPMFWHVDPSDRDAMLAMALNEGREKDLFELKNCVGKEVSKHMRRTRAKHRNPNHHAAVNVDERDRKDYFTPPTDLFLGHCHHIASRYGLGQDTVRNETVQDIDYRVVDTSLTEDKLFVVSTDKDVHYARVVVLAVGPGNKPVLPRLPGLNIEHGEAPPQVCHAFHIREFPDPVAQKRIAAKQCTNVLVIGSGLTSAQLTDLALRRGVTKVWHLMRGPRKVKLFDVDLSWMGKFRNVEQAYFHGRDSDAERLQHIRTARNGGSITPTYQKILERHQKAGTVDLRLFTSLTSTSFDPDAKLWSVTTDPPIPEMPRFDCIYFATGVESDFFTLPYLQTLLGKHPIERHGGLPSITEDLMWDKDLPFFVSGRFAGLQLGPAAGNLGGARAGAERIAWGVESLLTNINSSEDSPDKFDEELDYVTGRGNKFQILLQSGGSD